MSRSSGGGGGSSVGSLAQPPNNQASGQLGQTSSEIEGFASGVSGAIQDPLSMLVGQGVDFVINFIQPVQDALHMVTGDGPALRESADKFVQLQSACEKLAKELAETFDSQLANWQGEAADAARKKLAGFVEGVENTGLQAHNLSEMLKMSAVLMEAVEELIKGFITDFLTWAIATWIAALASSVVTAGGSTAVATAATGVQAGITCSRTAQTVQKFLRIINMISTVIEVVQAAIDAARIVESVQTIRSGTGDQGSGDELKAASDTAGNVADPASQAQENVESVSQAAGIDTEGGAESGAGDGTGGDSTGGTSGSSDGTSGSSDGSTSSTGGAQDGNQGNGFDAAGSVTENASEQLGDSADKLQEQAKEGGFSDVPADETISGQLNV